jgi:hypothetical protein
MDGGSSKPEGCSSIGSIIAFWVPATCSQNAKSETEGMDFVLLMIMLGLHCLMLLIVGVLIVGCAKTLAQCVFAWVATRLKRGRSPKIAQARGGRPTPLRTFRRAPVLSAGGGRRFQPAKSN